MRKVAHLVNSRNVRRNPALTVLEEIEMYLVDRPEPSQILIKARQLAGAQVEKLLKENHHDNDPKSYRWIKTDWTYPSFEHFTFAYKNALFPVFIELIVDGKSTMTDNEKSRFLDAAKKYNLIPCLFKVNVKRNKPNFIKSIMGKGVWGISVKNNTALGDGGEEILTPFTDGWNLYDLRNGNTIIPEHFGTNDNIPMSEWEIRNFAIQICRDEIKKRGWKLFSYCDLPEIDPQIWIQDEFGKVSWVLVRTIIKDEDKDYRNWIKKIRDISFIHKYDGYFAGVDTRPMNSFFGIDPTVNRGDPLTVRFLGFESVYLG
jgi:hypothetical protein